MWYIRNKPNKTKQPSERLKERKKGPKHTREMGFTSFMNTEQTRKLLGWQLEGGQNE